jgi:hypothetical protein
MEICHTIVTSIVIYISDLIQITNPKKQPQLPAKAMALTKKKTHTQKILQDFRRV